MQKKIGKVPFGINDDCRNSLQRDLFKHQDPQTCFARSRHTRDNAVRIQIRRIVIHVFPGQYIIGIEQFAKEHLIRINLGHFVLL